MELKEGCGCEDIALSEYKEAEARYLHGGSGARGPRRPGAALAIARSLSLAPFLKASSADPLQWCRCFLCWMLKYLLSQTMERNEIQGVHVTMLQSAGEWLGCRRDENYAYSNGCHFGVGCRNGGRRCKDSRGKQIKLKLVRKSIFVSMISII